MIHHEPLPEVGYGCSIWAEGISNGNRVEADTCARDRVFANVADRILFYGQRCKIKDECRVPLDDSYIKKQFRHRDNRGRYQAIVLNGPKVSGGESGMPWRNVDPSLVGRCWSPPKTGRYAQWINDTWIPEHRWRALNALRFIGLHARQSTSQAISQAESTVQRLPRRISMVLILPAYYQHKGGRLFESTCGLNSCHEQPFRFIPDPD